MATTSAAAGHTTVLHEVTSEGAVPYVKLFDGEVSSGDTPLGYEKVTGLSTAKGLTVPAGARFAMIIVEGQGIRYRDDGTNPTAADGMPLAAGGAIKYTGDLSAIIFIETAASAVLNVAYYG